MGIGAKIAFIVIALSGCSAHAVEAVWSTNVTPSATNYLFRCDDPRYFELCEAREIAKLPTFDELPKHPKAGWTAYIRDAQTCSFTDIVKGGGTLPCALMFNGKHWVSR